MSLQHYMRWKVTFALAAYCSAALPALPQASATPGLAAHVNAVEWQHATAETKAYMIRVAIAALQQGWTRGSSQAQSRIAGYLVTEYKHGAVPIRIPGTVGTMRVGDMPRYSRSTTYYVREIDRAYKRMPQMQPSYMSELLFCLADNASEDCKALRRTFASVKAGSRAAH
jgi:hypothetical protein